MVEEGKSIMASNREEIWNNLKSAVAIIIDTNVLINFFEKVEKGDQPDKYLRILRQYEENGQLFFSKQVINEFTVHCDHEAVKKNTQKKIKSEFSEILNSINNAKTHLSTLDKKYGYLKNKIERDELDNLVKNDLPAIKSQISSIKEGMTGEIDDRGTENSIRDFVLSDERKNFGKWDDRVEQYQWIQEGFSRVSHNIPPAYVDSYKKATPYKRVNIDMNSNRSIRNMGTGELTTYLGDFFIWKSILKFYIKNDSIKDGTIYFVTNDKKSDWQKDEHIRSELQEEFIDTCKRNHKQGDIQIINEEQLLSIDAPEFKVHRLALAMENRIEQILEKLLSDRFSYARDIDDYLTDSTEIAVWNDGSFGTGYYITDVEVHFEMNDFDLYQQVDTFNDESSITFVVRIHANGTVLVDTTTAEDEDDSVAPSSLSYNASVFAKVRIEFNISNIEEVDNTIQQIIDGDLDKMDDQFNENMNVEIFDEEVIFEDFS